MLEKWTGEVVGLMHIHRISAQELAKELGVSNKWVSLVLNGHRSPSDAPLRFRGAVDSIIRKREASTVGQED